jgi:hypothetical protein
MADRTKHEEKIRKRAYELWEQDGRPHLRDHDHWLRAEAELEAAGPQGNEGEGNVTAALAYDHSQTEFAEKADVKRKAKAAKKALDGPEGPELRKAEAAGKSHSKGEDPELRKKSTKSTKSPKAPKEPGSAKEPGKRV